MFNSKNVVVLFVVLCCSQISNVKAAIEVAKKSHNFNEGLVFIDSSPIKNGNLVYATCDKNSSSTTKCKVVQENHPYNEVTHSCLITLQGDHDESDLSVRMGIVSLGKDKAILLWTDYYNMSTTIKIGTVNLKTCKMSQAKIPDVGIAVFAELVYTSKIVSYDDDSYDIFFDDVKHCGAKMCKLQVDADGKAKGEATAAKMTNGFVSYASTIANRSPIKGYAYVKKMGGDSALWLVKTDGTESQLAKYEGPPVRVVSVGNDFISVCVNGTDVTCTQYEDDGDVKLTITMPDVDKNFQPLTVYNIPDGGLLVLFAEFEKCDPQTGCSKVTGYQITKIGVDGKKVGSLRTQELETATGESRKTYIYKNEDKGYCAAVIGQNPTMDEQKPSDFRIVVNCFTDDDFKA